MRPVLRPKTEMDGSNLGSDFEIQFWIRFLRVLWCGQNRQQLSGSKIGSKLGSLGFGLIGHQWAACAKHGNCWSTAYQISNHSRWTPNWGIHTGACLDPELIILVCEKLSPNVTGPFMFPKSRNPGSVGISTLAAAETCGWTQMRFLVYCCIRQLDRTRELLNMFRLLRLPYGQNGS